MTEKSLSGKKNCGACGIVYLSFSPFPPTAFSETVSFFATPEVVRHSVSVKAIPEKVFFLLPSWNISFPIYTNRFPFPT